MTDTSHDAPATTSADAQMHHPLATTVAPPTESDLQQRGSTGSSAAPVIASHAHPLQLQVVSTDATGTPTTASAITSSGRTLVPPGGGHLLHVHTGSSSPRSAAMSPSPSPAPPAPPLFLSSFTGCPRIADYFLVLGRVNDSETPLVPMRKLSRSNSQTIQPISDVVVILSDKPKDVPIDFTRLSDFSAREVDVNPGLLKTPVYLAESRVPRRRGSAVIMPITGLDVISIDKKEVPRPGFTQLPGNLNARSLRANVALCVERDAHKSPLIDIKIVCVPGGCKAIADAQKWHAQHPSASSSATLLDHKPITFPPHIPDPFTAIVPNEFIRVDHSVNASKDLFLVYKCAKRRAVEYHAYEPFLVDRYPEVDRPDFPLETQGVSMLSFPRGMLLKSEPVLPNFMTFVLTQASGSEVYGAALIFYEQLPQDPQNIPDATGSMAASSSGDDASNQLQPMYCPRCLCLLSHYPFYDMFKTFLNQLYRIAVSPSNMPLERFIGHFFNEVPVPRIYVPNILYTIGHAKVALSLPPTVGLPYKNFSLLTLFRCLSVENVILLFEHVLSEGKVVFYSNSHATLTPVAEAIRCLLFPMRWQCVFIPILPTNLAYTVRAPVPFIIGLHRSFLDELKVPEDVFLVDLDRNRVQLPNNILRAHYPDDHHGGADAHSPPGSVPTRNDDTKLLYPLPEYVKDYLQVELLDITTSPLDGHTLLYQQQDLSQEDCSMFQPPMLDADFNFNMDAAQIEAQELKIRVCFLKVMVTFLGHYRKFILLQAEESESFFDLDRLFDRKAFSKSFHASGDEALFQFARQLSDTQIFSSFILQRVAHAHNFQELFFFDYCVGLQREGAAAEANATQATATSSASNTPLVTPTASQQVLHHHSKTLSEVSKEQVKAARLLQLLKKKIHAPSLLQVTQLATSELLHSGSLTPQTLEAIRILPPSLIPMPRDWTTLSFEVPPPDASGLPEGRGPYAYDTFPPLDPMKFGDYRSDSSDFELARNLNRPNSPNASLKWILAPHPAQTAMPSSTPGGTTAVAEVASPSRPSHTRGSVGAKKKSSDRRGTELEAMDAAMASNEQARSKIVVSLFQHINALQERMRTWSGHDKTALQHAQVLYELWFAMFTASCEAERHRKREMRRRRIKDGTYYPLTFLSSPTSAGSVTSPLNVDGTPRSPTSFDAALSEAALRAEEHRECLADLLSLFIELHAMVSRGNVLPSERVLEDLSLFCLRMNLTREFQEIYRLFSTSVPNLSTRFFSQLIRIGVTTQLVNPQEALEGQLAEPASAHPLSTFEPSTPAPPAPAEDAISFAYPSSVHTFAQCMRCMYELSGEEILAGWMLHAERLASSCPLCDSSVTPQLVVRVGDGETMVDFMKPSSIRSTLHSLALLRRADGCAVAATEVCRSEYLGAVRTSSELFWNLFWFFVTRGPRSRGVARSSGLGVLPYHFLFSEENELLGRVATHYVVDVSPHRPWRVTAEVDTSNVLTSPFLSPYTPASTLRDRATSWDVDGGLSGTPSRSPRDSVDLQSHPPKKSILRKSLGAPADKQAMRSPSPSAAVLLDGLLDGADNEPDHRVKFNDADTDDSALFTLEHISASSDVDDSPNPSTTDAAAAAHSRRSSLTASNVQYIMTRVKSRAVHQAMRTILRARVARKSWTSTERREDEAFFRGSMYQTLAGLMPAEANDPVAFVVEYKQALASLDATIAVHKHAIETLDAANTLHANGSTTSPPQPSMDFETAQVLELRNKKKVLTIAALEESVAMKAEVMLCDAPPLPANITMLQPVRKLFGEHLHRAITRASAPRNASIIIGAGAGGFLDDILAHDVPTLEDCLTQVAQNPHYTLQGFMQFASEFRTPYELNVLGQQAELAGGASPMAPLCAPTPMGHQTSGEAAHTSSIALCYVRFWGAVRRWRVRYERNDRHRSLSIVIKSPSALGSAVTPFDSVFESARSIYERFLASQSDLESPPAAALHDCTVIPSALATVLPMPPADRARSGSTTSDHRPRRGSMTLLPIAETSPVQHPSDALSESDVAITLSSSDGDSSASPVDEVHHPTLSIEAPSPHPTGLILPVSHFGVAPTPVSQGHVTTIRGIILPRPLHESIRRVLNEKVAPADIVDPLLGTVLSGSGLVHHSVPKHLFDDAAAVVLNWLKKHVFSAYLQKVQAEEDEEMRAEEAAVAAAAILALAPPTLPPRPAKLHSTPPSVDRSRRPSLTRSEQQQPVLLDLTSDHATDPAPPSTLTSLPLLRNTSSEAVALAKTGGHVPDFSSASPALTTEDQLP